tara:strand:- start:140 stop:1372 length:1233 start_codon:yes stop_codon:yes gene_type:complete
MTDTDLAVPGEQALTVPTDDGGTSQVELILKRRENVVSLMRQAMSEGVHYGEVPHTRGKKSLFQPGADLLIQLRNASAKVETIERLNLDNDHYLYRSQATISSGNQNWVAEGTASSKERRYWRSGKPSDNPTDLDNTVCKMAHKRAKVAAALLMSGASDLFTQDIEDLKANGVIDAGPPKMSAPSRAEAEPPGEGITRNQMKALHAGGSALGWSHEDLSLKVCSRFGVDSLTQLSEAQAELALKKLRKNVEELSDRKVRTASTEERKNEELDNMQFDGLDSARSAVRKIYDSARDRAKQDPAFKRALDSAFGGADVAALINDTTQQGELSNVSALLEGIFNDLKPAEADGGGESESDEAYYAKLEELDEIGELNDWESKFVEDLLGKKGQYPLSPKQKSTILKVHRESLS